jgi:hypothetical protein
MGKRKALNIIIPKPCGEDWDKMTPDGNGRHCDSCSKTIIDFSRFTDRELVEFWKKAKGKLCGRFSQYQINRAIPIPVENNNSIFHKALFGTALAAGLTATANGQTIQSVPPVQVPVPTANNVNQNTSGTQNHKQNRPTQIRGKVIDSKTKEPIEGVAVFITDAQAVRTDSNGRFVIVIPDSLQGTTIALNFDIYEHKSRVINLAPKKQANYMKVEMEPHKEVFLMGEPAYPFPNTYKDSTSH